MVLLTAWKRSDFYPRSPCGERRWIRQRNKFRDSHFYPRSPCGERRINRVKRLLPSWISIHALLAESDPLTHVRSPSANISIHALLAESDRPQHHRGRV